MWLLKLHFSISVLCLLTFIGFRAVFKDQIKENGYLQKNNKKGFSSWLFFLVPILNIFLVVTLFSMILMKKSEFDKKCNELKENCAEKE